MKVWIYAAATVGLSVLLCQWFYNSGKALWEVTAQKRTNPVIEALAAAAGKADYPRFFEVALVAAGVVLFFPLVWWLRGISYTARAILFGRKRDLGWGTVFSGIGGFLLTAALFLGTGYALLKVGSFEWRHPDVLPAGLGRTLAIWAGLALAAGFFQELIFRGAALRVFLWAMPPWLAIGLSALLFAGLYFLNPPAGLTVVNPESADASYEMLGLAAARFTSPLELLREFLPLFAGGCALAYARWRTNSLWLPVGLVAGWFFANGVFLHLAVPVERADTFARLLAGTSLESGLIPCALIGFTAALLYFLPPADAKSPSTGPG